MIFAKFYEPAENDPNDIRLVKGEDGIKMLNIRDCIEDNREIATEICKSHGYAGFTIHRGESIQNNNEVSRFKRV